MVIMENVCSAPWDQIITYWAKNKYTANQMRVDTKNYYITHTRTRGYLLAVDEKHSSLAKKWTDLVGDMKRPASSTLDAFLLPTDDARIHQAREKLVRNRRPATANELDRRLGALVREDLDDAVRQETIEEPEGDRKVARAHFELQEERRARDDASGDGESRAPRDVGVAHQSVPFRL